MTAKRRPAARPAPRTVEVTGTGEFATWEARALASFRAAWLVELESGSVTRILAVLERIVVDHNMPNADGELAEHLADVDPYDGLLNVAGAITDAIGKLPPR